MIFDLDGVLAISEPLLAEAAIELFAEKGALATAGDFRPFIGMGEDRYLGGAAATLGVHIEAAGDKKPAPDIFLEACRRITLPPAACLVVEDAVSGVAAAKAAGARCLAVTTSFGEAELRDADWIASDLAHVPPAALAW